MHFAMSFCTSAVLLSVLLSVPGLAADKAVPLVKGGTPASVIVVSKDVVNWKAPKSGRERRQRGYEWQEDIRKAADELREHVKLITGAELEIVAAGSDLGERLPIYIGSAAGEELVAKVKATSTKSGSFALVVAPEAIRICALTPHDTQFGVFELLEQMGVRWYMPEEIGRVLPEKTADLSVAVQDKVHVPDFANRHLQAVRNPEWETRLRTGGTHFPSSHGIHLPKEASFEEHPEYYALIDGERKKRQLCVSNPDVVKMATENARNFFRAHPDAEIMGIGANDGRGFCECEKCKALDGDDFDRYGNYPSMTDRYVWLFNQILDGIADEFPDKKLGFYAYSVYNRPPVKVKPNRRIVPAVALITLCRIHGFNNPACPEKKYEQWIIAEWGKIVDEVYYRGYWFNLADPGLPFFMMKRIASEIPLGKKMGLAGWRVESPYNWAGSCPSRYLALKLMWDLNTDMQALLDEFYVKFFGPASAPMKRYIEAMDNARHNGDYHTGSSWDMPAMYGGAVTELARESFKKATELAPEGTLYAKRVQVYREQWEYFEAFADMMNSRAKHDYVASKKALDRVNELRKVLWAYKPPMINRKAESYLKRFFSLPTEQGYERVTDGNTFLAGMDDVWQFQTDPKRAGEEAGWYKVGDIGGEWKPLHTTSSTWSTQGLRYYKGIAWYRQSVAIPTAAKGKRVFLWVGAYDEGMKVWVNGKEVGISPKMSFRPCEFDVTNAVKPGEKNLVAICVLNDALNEVGTGGIMGPVMFYLPADGRELKNLKPFGKTFPEYD